ncbi:hypothetical protein BX661DRAFT_185990 [Kickxella alabastrina]|uniref:uncharacterized protein n=1 Tax=Kickxella alabastrina TaxID=61397 RepID=UPI0022207467|nr:uncharacterized protein BX661DRAFT_185990 [Kickxella alabastrina]KAI7823953.1 hypothetical protein BX661DRAFT_185990 [Kickxella alabastrina]
MKVSVLDKYTVRDVMEYRGNPQLNHNIEDTDTIEEALRLMDTYDIVSLPVFGRSKGGDQERSSFVDIVSVYDLRDYIIQSQDLEEEVHFQLLSGRPSGNPTVLQHTVSQVVRSRKHASKEISASASLEQLLRLFTSMGQHRVLVTDLELGPSFPQYHHAQQQVPEKPDKPFGYGGRQRGYSIDSACSTNSTVEYIEEEGNVVVCGLTQYDVVRFIQHHNHELWHSLDVSAMDLANEKFSSEGGKSVDLSKLPHLSVRDSALSAMKQLRDSRASALPVVDHDGRLITEVAGTGMRRLNTSSIGMLGKPVLAFMFGLRLTVTRPYVVHQGFTLSQIMSGLLRMNCRRAWMVDQAGHPIAVISLTNVLQHFL